MKVKSESEVAQSCPTLSDLMDCSLPGSSAHGIFQARVLGFGIYNNLLMEWRKTINNVYMDFLLTQTMLGSLGTQNQKHIDE